jgi:protein-S-isoprenylcysteine O-methyltransferase Ste14
MIRLLYSLGWLACVVYSTIPSFWLLIHPRADYWRSRSRSPYRVLLPIWIAMWVVAALATMRWRNISFYEAGWSWLPACALLFAGIAIYKTAGAGFSAAQLGGLPELLPSHRDQRLVTSGIRNRIRHPIYLGHFCEMMAWSIGTGLIVCYALTVFAMLTGAIMIRKEDKELEQRFGEEYREYRRKVPAALPKL